MGTYYLIRHGETDANKKGILQGHLNIPLNDMGRSEAKLAARALSSISLEAIYASDLSRARETAEIIAKEQKGTPCLMLDRRLREIHCGRLQGLTISETKERFPEFHMRLKDDPLRTRRPGGESYEDLFERSVRALEDIYKNYPDGNVAIVSHGGVVRCLLAYASGKEVNPASLTVANGSISVISREKNAWNVVSVNNIEHLSSVLDVDSVKETDQAYRWQ